jgi:hypothetical protein
MKTPYPAPSRFTEATGRPITGGSWFHLRQWPPKTEAHYEAPELYSCFLWRAEQSSSGQLTLVAYGEEKRLRLTRERSREIVAFQPSDSFFLHEYPTEWRRWLEAGVGLYLTGDFKRISLNTHWDGRYWVGSMDLDIGRRRDAEKEKTEFKWLLMEALFWHLHSRKAERIKTEHGEQGIIEATQQFVAEMEKREAQGLSSLPVKRKS